MQTFGVGQSVDDGFNVGNDGGDDAFGLALRAGFFLATALDLRFATVLRFLLASAADRFFAFFFVLAADFLRVFLAIGSPQMMQV